jgi:26S proteasome regulatory subunit N11
MPKSEIIKIKSSVLKKIKEHALSIYQEFKSEVIGYLIGNFEEGIILIDDIVIPKQDSTNIHAEITDERSLTDYLNDNLNKILVGWYHSHPNLGCFLSSVDVPTQKYWQRVNDKMVALVIDPIRNEIKIFRLDENEQTYEIAFKKI